MAFLQTGPKSAARTGDLTSKPKGRSKTTAALLPLRHLIGV